MAFRDRIDEIAADQGINLTEFAKKIDISYRTLQNYLSGTSPPKVKFYRSICETFNVSADWVLFGTGPKYSPQRDPLRNKLRLVSSDGESGLVPIPRYEIEASAGHGSGLGLEAETAQYGFKRDWLDKRGLKTDSLSVIAVTGNSMEPELYDRDLVLIDHASTKLADSNIYAVRFSDALYVKRIQQQPGGRVLLISKNKDYPPIEIENPIADGVEVIGRIVASMHEW